jgi:uncharacterized protein YegL
MKSKYKGFEFRNAIVAACHKIASDLGLGSVTVAFHAGVQTACINAHGDIRLANVKDDAILTHADLQRYAGFVLHELLHRKYTNFNVRDGNDYIDSLHNAVEDAWIEHNAITQKLTGNAEGLLSALVDGMVTDALADTRFQPFHPQSYPFVLAIYLRKHATVKVPLAQGLEPIFEQAAVKLAKCNDSEDTLEVARWVFDQLKQVNKPKAKKPKQPKQPEQGKGKGKGQGQGEGQGEGEGEGQGQGKGQQQGAGEGQGQDAGQGNEKGSGSPSKGSTAGDQEEAGTTPATPLATSPVDVNGTHCGAIEVEPTSKAPKGAGSRGTYNPASTLKRNDYHVSHGANHFDLGEVVPAGLRYGVKRLFENTALEQFQTNRKAGSLNVSSLHTIAVGNDRVFKRRQEEEGIDSAVVILLDVSGSMFRANNYKDTLMASAVQAVYALLDTLNKAGVATAVVTFGSNCGLLKPFNMPVKKTVPLLRSLGNGGDTNDYFGLAYAHELLRGRPEARKVAFVLTDGDGNRQATKDQARSGTALGITTVGIGIKHDVSEVYPINVRVNNVADLGSVAFTKLKLAA